MSFMDKLKGMVGVEDEDYEEYEEYDDNREVFSAKEENDHRSDRDNSKNKVMNINATCLLYTSRCV